MRLIKSLNKGWHFIKKNVKVEEVLKTKGKKINVPHTWNNLDGQDGGSDYYRGSCWYVKKLGKIVLEANEDVYLEFEGVHSIADVYLNSELVGHHEGGFSTFRVNITDKINGQNILMVKVDNSPNDYIYPQWADFTFFGGIYRNVNLIRVNKTHFDLDYYGGPGITVTPEVVGKNAKVNVCCYVSNYNNEKIGVTVYDQDKNVVHSSIEDNLKFSFNIENVRLWNGRIDPHLYTLEVKLVRDDLVLDNKLIRFGCRSFEIDPDKGFFLNDVSYPLRGVSRHQDRLNKGWAISYKDHEQDMDLICEVGANTIRLAHYQHDQHFYDLCDEKGMVVWAEIPFISHFLPKGYDNTMSQMKELIVQNYNHPSIVVWGLSNEITMAGESEENLKNHRDLNNLVHSMDATRLTTMAQVSMLDTKSPMNHVSDVISYNHYFGWYGGDVEDNAVWFDKFHEENPDICFGISEYGCECVLNWHTSNPEMGDYSEEYQAHYHHVMLETFATRPYLWATHVWNMFDFAADSRDEGGYKGRNDKGLVTFDRKTKKDSFYLYQAYWSDKPMLHLAKKRYVYRCENVTEVLVYSNQKEVSLYVNGKLHSTQKGEHVFRFEVKLEGKTTKLVAKSGNLSDKSVVKKVKELYKGYILDAAPGAVVNWFDKDGKEVQMTYNRDYLCIKDKIKEIMANEEGKKVLMGFMAQMQEQMKNFGGEGGVKLNDGMMKMMMGFTIERIAKLLGDKISPEVVYKINEQLQKIKK